MDNPEFTILWLENLSNIPIRDIKAYANAASTEIIRIRGQLEYERARTVAELEAAHRRALATEDRIAALEATGLMQQVVASELEM